MPYDVTLLAVYTLTLASITRLVIGDDVLTHRPHNWVMDALENADAWATDFFDSARWSAGWFTAGAISGVVWFLRELISCNWCAPFWLGALMLWGYDYWLNPAVLFISLALAMRFVAGLLTSIGR